MEINSVPAKISTVSSKPLIPLPAEYISDRFNTIGRVHWPTGYRSDYKPSSAFLSASSTLHTAPVSTTGAILLNSTSDRLGIAPLSTRGGPISSGNPRTSKSQAIKSKAPNHYAYQSDMPDSVTRSTAQITSRQRTVHACGQCRERKTKCSGEQPICHRCAARGLCCSYETTSMRDYRLLHAHARENNRNRTFSGKQAAHQSEDLMAEPWQAINAPTPIRPIPTFMTHPEENSPVLPHATYRNSRPFGRQVSSSYASSDLTGVYLPPLSTIVHEEGQAYDARVEQSIAPTTLLSIFNEDFVNSRLAFGVGWQQHDVDQINRRRAPPTSMMDVHLVAQRPALPVLNPPVDYHEPDVSIAMSLSPTSSNTPYSLSSVTSSSALQTPSPTGISQSGVECTCPMRDDDFSFLEDPAYLAYISQVAVDLNFYPNMPV